nr:hypothetical protein [Nannocystis sp.]
MIRPHGAPERRPSSSSKLAPLPLNELAGADEKPAPEDEPNMLDAGAEPPKGDAGAASAEPPKGDAGATSAEPPKGEAAGAEPPKGDAGTDAGAEPPKGDAGADAAGEPPKGEATGVLTGAG